MTLLHCEMHKYKPSIHKMRLFFPASTSSRACEAHGLALEVSKMVMGSFSRSNIFKILTSPLSSTQGKSSTRKAPTEVKATA